MHHFSRHLVSIAATLAFIGFCNPAGATLVQYSYLGNAFTDISSGFSVSRVSIRFTVDASLISNNSHIVLDSYNAKNLGDYSFGNGYQVLSNDPANDLSIYTSASVSFDTDADGNITGNWDAHAGRVHGNQGGLILNDFIGSSSMLDSTSSLGGYAAFVANHAGAWTRGVPGTIPLPGGLVLFGSSLLGLCLQRRFKVDEKIGA